MFSSSKVLHFNKLKSENWKKESILETLYYTLRDMGQFLVFFLRGLVERISDIYRADVVKKIWHGAIKTKYAGASFDELEVRESKNFHLPPLYFGVDLEDSGWKFCGKQPAPITKEELIIDSVIALRAPPLS